MRQEHEAAVARGLVSEETGTSRPRSRSSPDSKPRPEPAAKNQRMKLVWQVCDLGGRTVATFAYSEKAEAEACAARLKAKSKDNHFVRSEKVPMD